MNWLKEGRRRRGLSQRGLAAKAGVAYKTVQLIESARHDPRWSTLVKLQEVLGPHAPESLEQIVSRHFGAGGDTAAEAGARILEDGEALWKLWLLEFVDSFRRRPHFDKVAQAPDYRLKPRLLALLASTAEALCAEAGICAPWWCSGVPAIKEPWFPSEMENLMASAIVESPAHFRRRNIFVLANFLRRA